MRTTPARQLNRLPMRGNGTMNFKAKRAGHPCPHDFPFRFHKTQAEIRMTDRQLIERQRDTVIADMTDMGYSRAKIAEQAHCTTSMISIRRAEMGMT